MNELGVIALEPGQMKNELTSTTLSTKSDLICKHEFLGFNDDYKFSQLKKNRSYN